MNRKTKKIFYFIFILLMIVCSVILFIESTKTPEEYKPTPSEIEVDQSTVEDVEVNDFRVKLSPDVNLAVERGKHHNNDIVGRLEIPGLFNVLVARTTNNTFYLDHSIDKKYDVRGTEFLDYLTSPTSKQVNIYGHNSRDQNVKVPFLKLEKFLDKSFFDSNPYVILQHDSGKSLYEIKSITEVYETNVEHMIFTYTGEEFVKHVDRMTSNPINSRDVMVDEDSEILVLQTCSHHLTNAVYLIVAVKVDYAF